MQSLLSAQAFTAANSSGLLLKQTDDDFEGDFVGEPVGDFEGDAVVKLVGDFEGEGQEHADAQKGPHSDACGLS